MSEITYEWDIQKTWKHPYSGTITSSSASSAQYVNYVWYTPDDYQAYSVYIEPKKVLNKNIRIL